MIALSTNKLKEMIDAGAKAVSAEYEYINELNVFPVPDGDTGTNMMITINGAFDSIKNIDFNDIQLLGKQFSRGLLMNARGNSGVIFSQIIKGFTSNFKPGKGEIGMLDFVEAFTNAKNIAYNAVATPIEGTILTVIRVTAEQLNKHRHFKSIEDVMELACKEARIILSKTPQMLKELKEVGVVDSGGYGLCCFFDGMLTALKEKGIKGKQKEDKSKKNIEKIIARKSFVDSYDDNNVGFGYCCEFILSLQTRVSLKQPQKHKFDLGYFKKELSKIGDSTAVIVDDGIVKLHIHSLWPYRVLEVGAKYGEFNKVKIENMTQQFLERNPGTTLETLQNEIRLRKKMSSVVKIIATVPSETMAKFYAKELSIENVINTEISGNPSIQEFIDEIRKANTSNIVIVADDSNVILAANEAASLVANDVKIKVINARNIIASYLACLYFDPVMDLNDNAKKLEQIIEDTATGKISISTKHVEYSHLNVKKNDYIGIIDKKVEFANTNVQKVLTDLSNKLVDEIRKPKKAYIISGRNADLKDIKFLRKYLSEEHSLKITYLEGEQPTYLFYIAITR